MLSGMLYILLSVHSTIVTCRADFRLVSGVVPLQISVPLKEYQANRIIELSDALTELSYIL